MTEQAAATTPDSIELELDGGDHLVYIPSGPNPLPLFLDADIRFSDTELLVNEREHAVLTTLLKLALRKLESGQPHKD